MSHLKEAIHRNYLRRGAWSARHPVLAAVGVGFLTGALVMGIGWLTGHGFTALPVGVAAGLFFGVGFHREIKSEGPSST